MPIYTYQCDNCGIRFEQQQSFNDPPWFAVRSATKTPCGKFIRRSGLSSKDRVFMPRIIALLPEQAAAQLAPIGIIRHLRHQRILRQRRPRRLQNLPHQERYHETRRNAQNC